MTKLQEEKIKEIEKIASVAFNQEQKAIAKKIILNTQDCDLHEVFNLITQRVKLGFVFDCAPEVNHNAVSFIKEDENLNINLDGLENPNNIEHKLIIGENYDALKNLLITHYERIDVIYIDPPYNTEASKSDGNDYKDEITASKFVYRDKFTRNGWLNMMNERLKLARKLLKDSGVIFISIDDSEQAYLKVLCDEIFGENNFVACLVWANTQGGIGSDSKYFRNKHEYILCYAKNKSNLEIYGQEVEDIAKYNLQDEFENTRGKFLLKDLCVGSLGYVSSLDFAITAPDNTLIYPNIDGQNINRWRWSKEKVKWGIENHFIEFKKKQNGAWGVYTKQYLNCDNEGNVKIRTQQPLSFINKYSNIDSSKHLKSIFNTSAFSYAKPIELIKYLLQISLSHATTNNNGGGESYSIHTA